ncbi:hypothetical protein N0V88_003568 [Collariella sp. IMI 366227]|nr:hypothetical protein N0V88_003568 [Collariella sp. IMI 366227]
MDSSKTTQQQKDTKPTEGNPLSKAADTVKEAFQAHSANPGPAIPKEFNVQEEGTKEERRAKAQELNKQ